MHSAGRNTLYGRDWMYPQVSPESTRNMNRGTYPQLRPPPRDSVIAAALAIQRIHVINMLRKAQCELEAQRTRIQLT